MSRKKKAAPSDFTPAMLPQTRKAVFRDVLSLQWRSLLTLGVTTLLFGIPLLLSGLASDLYLANFQAELDGQITTEALNALIYWGIGRNALNILFILLLSVGVAGLLRPVRQFAWEENVHIPTDFGRSLKENLRQTAALALLSGLIYFLCVVLLYSASGYRSAMVSTLSLLPVFISVLLIGPVFALTLAMIPVYSNSLTANFKNALYIYTHAPLKTSGRLLICLAILLPSLLPNFYCHLFGMAAALLLAPFSLLAWLLSCFDLFDRFINPDCCPELISKGLYQGDTDTDTP